MGHVGSIFRGIFVGGWTSNTSTSKQHKNGIPNAMLFPTVSNVRHGDFHSISPKFAAKTRAQTSDQRQARAALSHLSLKGRRRGQRFSCRTEKVELKWSGDVLRSWKTCKCPISFHGIERFFVPSAAVFESWEQHALCPVLFLSSPWPVLQLCASWRLSPASWTAWPSCQLRRAEHVPWTQEPWQRQLVSWLLAHHRMRKPSSSRVSLAANPGNHVAECGRPAVSSRGFSPNQLLLM